MKLKLKARMNRSDARTIRHALEQLSAKGSIRKAGDEFIVEAEMGGASARELNRILAEPGKTGCQLPVVRRPSIPASFLVDVGRRRVR